ncbi:toxin-antitoxin system YwqK family antitoxin [Flavobacterium sp.]|jgi:antitoxin component YwqK of YwqJK toxin-antitoxin module|uniref:toxin-antitoxin system YwqK family antitoxin n=1 Tax=Flavobacterium sp. TaxID=239 RepID=UPI0037C049AB
MKNLFIAAMLVVSGVIFAQENNVKHEIVNKLVKSTFYYDNGQIQQEGFYKNGKVHGEWISYNMNGEKVAIGKYENGKKVGKWFFWSGADLMEVDYTDTRVAQVKKWSSEAIVLNK